MRAVVERVHQAAVVIDQETVASIDKGLLVYVGVAADDDESDSRYLAEKIRFLRVFPDDEKPLNRDVVDAGGKILAISAFTTQADARKGRRPALIQAADPENANRLYQLFCEQLRASGVVTKTGRFREHMDVTSTNDGPICVLLDSKRLF